MLASVNPRRPPAGVPAGLAQDRLAPGRPFRVLVVTARFLPDVGGTESHVYEVTRRLASRGDLDLTVLTTDRSGRRPARQQLGGFTVLRCRAYPRRRDYYVAPGIYRQVSAGNWDLIHCQGVHTAVPVLAMLAARRARIPYLVTFHTGGHSSVARNRMRNAQWRALGPLLRGASGVVAVSRFERRIFEDACHIDPARFRMVQNGGDLPREAAPAGVVPGRIVSSGRLERYKGHQRVIEALPIVRQAVPDATLHILGSGPYEGHLRSLVSTLGLDTCVTIESIAADDREAMARSLGEAAVVAALSEYEAHPVAVMEALALGVPAVGLDTAGTGDLVQDGLVRGVPRDSSPATIAAALVAALQDGPTRGEAALPTWDTAAAGLADVYLEAVRAVPRPPGR